MSAHLTPEVSNRGFKRLPPVQTHWEGQDTGTVTVYESSSDAPSLWLHAEAAVGYGAPDQRTSLHLSLDEAAKLRDQLTWLIDHHYQGDNPL